jgi:hypothetical protein
MIRLEAEMSMILRFPIERVRPAHANVFESEEATVLILPAVRIEREGTEEVPAPSANDTGGGSGRRRRVPRL